MLKYIPISHTYTHTPTLTHSHTHTHTHSHTHTHTHTHTHIQIAYVLDLLKKINILLISSKNFACVNKIKF